jgi:hypothetical protein
LVWNTTGSVLLTGTVRSSMADAVPRSPNVRTTGVDDDGRRTVESYRHSSTTVSRGGVTVTGTSEGIYRP